MTPQRARTITTINGRRVRDDHATISVFDNSLLYAEGLFETFLACEDRVLFMDEHVDRLYRGARVIDLAPPVSRRTLARWMKATVKAHPDRITKLRLTITSGEAARWVGVAGKPQVILSAAPHALPTEPFRLQVSNFRVDQDSEFRRIKTISYAIHAAALRHARLDGFDDALMLNKKGHVAEVTSANIFWRRGNRIYTPPVAAGCLEGVTRRVIFGGAKEHGLSIAERSESFEHMITADEVFIASSLKLAIGVAEIAEGRRRYRFAPGATTERIVEWLYHKAGI